MTPKPSDYRPDESDKAQSMKWFALAGLGVEFAVSVAGGCLLGWYLDGRWGTSPWLLITGAALGFGLGLYSMIKAVKRVFPD